MYNMYQFLVCSHLFFKCGLFGIHSMYCSQHIEHHIGDFE